MHAAGWRVKASGQKWLGHLGCGELKHAGWAAARLESTGRHAAAACPRVLADVPASLQPACLPAHPASLATTLPPFQVVEMEKYFVFEHQPGGLEWRVLEEACAELDKLAALVDGKIKVGWEHNSMCGGRVCAADLDRR